MDNMKCYGTFKNNELCDMCKLVNYVQFNGCKNTKNKSNETQAQLEEIAKNCPYASECWDEYTKFNGCTLNGYNGRFTDGCHPKISCLSLKK
jgi:hypothetical protein